MGKKISVMTLGLLLLLSAILIFYKFNQIPRTLTYDEVEFAYLALILEKSPYTIFTTFADGHATIYFYIILLFFKLFGVSSFVLRLPSAIFGILNVTIFYGIARIVFSKKMRLSIPFVLSLILLTSHWYFNFVRFSFETSFLLFLELFSIFFFLRFWKHSRTSDAVFSGVFAGLAFHSYQPGRIFFLLPLLCLISEKKPIKKIAAFFLSFFIVVVPLVFFWLTTPGSDVRVNQQLYFKDTRLTGYDKTIYLGENITKTALMFGVKGDLNGRHNYPGKAAFNPLLFGLFFLGIALSLKNLKNFFNQFFILYFLLAIIPTLLTQPVENPNMLRTFTALPSAMFFIGLSLEKLLQWGKKYAAVLSILIIVGVLISSLYELRTYFKFQSVVFENAFERRPDLQKGLNRYRRVGKDYYRNHPRRQKK